MTNGLHRATLRERERERERERFEGLEVDLFVYPTLYSGDDPGYLATHANADSSQSMLKGAIRLLKGQFYRYPRKFVFGIQNVFIPAKEYYYTD
jgi:hypothetical protein